MQLVTYYYQALYERRQLPIHTRIHHRQALTEGLYHNGPIQTGKPVPSMH